MNPRQTAPTHFSDMRFTSRYLDARKNWLAIASAFGTSAQIESIPHALKGPDGEALATDCLWLGAADAPRVIVTISGTHGIEGYAGNAIQCHWLKALQAGRQKLPADTALLCIHALTPWGMAWYRRCDEQGIDLNRNFIDFTQLPANADYARVRDCLHLQDRDARISALQDLQNELGQRRFEIAVSGGQYEDPKAPFFGGHQPSHGREVIERLIRSRALFTRTLHVIDLHTGLGPRGEGELICDHPLDSAGLRASLAAFGSQITLPADGSSSSVPKHGLLDYAWHAGMNDKSFFLTLEFGTNSAAELFGCLEEDHRFWAERTPQRRDDAGWAVVREPMLAHFCPDDATWRNCVMQRGDEVFRTLLALS